MTSAFEPGADQVTGTPTADPVVPIPAGEAPAAVDDGAADGTWWADGPLDPAAETAELIAQIRELAAHDPSGVQQVVAEVLEAINRATGGAFAATTGSVEGGYDAPTVGYDDPAVRYDDPTVGHDHPKIEFVDMDSPTGRDASDLG